MSVPSDLDGPPPMTEAEDSFARLHDSSHPATTAKTNITLIGAGTIGLSFAALHLTSNPHAHVTIHDTRPDLTEHIINTLPQYISSSSGIFDDYSERITISTDLASAVSTADIVQEQGPENASFKTTIWATIESHAPPSALFWSSTSGIAASAQAVNMRDQTRLLVVHPYNPPHVMPLLEVVPSPQTNSTYVERTMAYWARVGRTPVLLHKEVPGFVANRLAFALFREAISLVNDGVVSVKDLDAIVETSMGPRWAVNGPFKSYHAGGGKGGLSAFMANIGGTVRDCWAAGEEIKVGPGGVEEGWEESICKEAEEAYGVVDTKERDAITKDVLSAVKNGRADSKLTREQS
ncbi:hypothetical protein MBLNU457_2282t1 [Dothideomycetes sp. NU457]